MLTRPGIGEPISLILKLPGDACTINCHYCYEKRKPEQAFSIMSGQLVARALSVFGNRPLAVELHGGEPLMIGKASMRGVLRAIRGYSGPSRVTLQTNGIALDDEWIDLFVTEIPDIEFSTSLDGTPATSAHRVDFKDRPTHHLVEALFERFEKRGLKIGCICTVTKPVLGHAPEILEYFSQFPALNLLKLNPCFDVNVTTRMFPGNNPSLAILNPSAQGIPGWGISPGEFKDFLAQFLSAWSTGPSFGRLMVEPFLSIMRSVGGKETGFCVYSEKKCGHVLTLYPDGRLTACDEFQSTDSPGLGVLDDLTTPLRDPLSRSPSLTAKLDSLLEDCAVCSHQTLCRGGCLATRLRLKGTHLYQEYCDYRIAVIENMRSLLAKEGATTNEPVTALAQTV